MISRIIRFISILSSLLFASCAGRVETEGRGMARIAKVTSIHIGTQKMEDIEYLDRYLTEHFGSGTKIPTSYGYLTRYSNIKGADFMDFYFESDDRVFNPVTKIFIRDVKVGTRSIPDPKSITVHSTYSIEEIRSSSKTKDSTIYDAYLYEVIEKDRVIDIRLSYED